MCGIVTPAPRFDDLCVHSGAVNLLDGANPLPKSVCAGSTAEHAHLVPSGCEAVPCAAASVRAGRRRLVRCAECRIGQADAHLYALGRPGRNGIYARIDRTVPARESGH